MKTLIVLLALALASPALADWETAPGQIVLLSDEIFGNSVNVTRPSDSAAVSGNDKNKSGMGDATNPGQGSGTANSPNEGTDNPNDSGN